MTRLDEALAMSAAPRMALPLPDHRLQLASPDLVAANDDLRSGKDGADGLPGMLPRVTNWAREQETISLMAGKPLARWQVEDARQVGVQRPERVRLLYVDAIPLPLDGQVRLAAARTGLICMESVGATFGYAVLILRGCVGLRRVLRRQLRHVAQMERVGSSVGFLAEYLRQITFFGLTEAPFYVDAAAHETPAMAISAVG
jgi:hypothetical protein